MLYNSQFTDEEQKQKVQKKNSWHRKQAGSRNKLENIQNKILICFFISTNDMRAGPNTVMLSKITQDMLKC
jgi:hypothetical protein